MLGKKTVLEKRIDELEEKGKYLEEKTKQALELLDTLDTELDNLQNMMMLSRPQASSESHILASPQIQNNPMPVHSPLEASPSFTPTRLDMTGKDQENSILKDGWWPSEGKFRWTGKDNKDASLHFNVSSGRDYELTAKIFVPGVLTRKPIKIIANDTELADFSADKEMQIERNITIPKNIITDGNLKISFISGFWIPKEIDPDINDTRTLSLAFEYIELS